MDTNGSTGGPSTPAPWTAARIFKVALVITAGVLVALLSTFALLALLFA
jgi:hypothetical protein